MWVCMYAYVRTYRYMRLNGWTDFIHIRHHCSVPGEHELCNPKCRDPSPPKHKIAICLMSVTFFINSK
jgi:hypothetical protein